MNTLDCFATYREHAAKIHDYLKSIPSSTVSSKVIMAWEQGGLLSPTWGENGELVRLWTNVIAHQAVTAVLVHRISIHVSSFLSINENYTINDMVEAALVHDAYKRREWEINEKAKKLGKDWAESNRGAELNSRQFLAKIGFSDNILRLTKATGDIGLELMMTGNATIGEKVIFYADCCVSNDEIVSYKQRFDDLLPHFQPGGRYESVNETYARKYNGRTHRQVWDSVVIPIQEQLAQLTEFRGAPEELYKI